MGRHAGRRCSAAAATAAALPAATGIAARRSPRCLQSLRIFLAAALLGRGSLPLSLWAGSTLGRLQEQLQPLYTTWLK